MVASTKQKLINMKKLFTISLVAMLMASILFPDSIMAGNKTSYTVAMHKQPKRQTGHNKDLDEEGLRMPPMPISCFINKTDGVTIIGVPEDIINYEIWDISHEVNIGFFSEESDFIDYLFLQTGDFQLNFETENYHVFGYITIN